MPVYSDMDAFSSVRFKVELKMPVIPARDVSGSVCAYSTRVLCPVLALVVLLRVQFKRRGVGMNV